MALRILNVLTRGTREFTKIQPILFQGMAKWKRPSPILKEVGDSIKASLYKDEIPESVLLNRVKHLPDKKESPFKEARRVCILCQLKITPNYKNVRLLSQFVSGFSGIVYDRHITGLCKFRQRQVEKEVQKSRHAGLMPHTFKVPQYHRDPKLFDPAKPVRPHPYF